MRYHPVPVSGFLGKLLPLHPHRAGPSAPATGVSRPSRALDQVIQVAASTGGSGLLLGFRVPVQLKAPAVSWVPMGALMVMVQLLQRVARPAGRIHPFAAGQQAARRSRKCQPSGPRSTSKVRMLGGRKLRVAFKRSLALRISGYVAAPGCVYVCWGWAAGCPTLLAAAACPAGLPVPHWGGAGGFLLFQIATSASGARLRHGRGDHRPWRQAAGQVFKDSSSASWPNSWHHKRFLPPHGRRGGL